MIHPLPQQKETRLSIEEMVRQVRERICMDDPTTETVLFETELSREFQVSRTPIRQVLQRLAYEQLVRTVSGVGTVVIPLHAEQREAQANTFEALLRLAARQHECSEMHAPPFPKNPADYLNFRSDLLDHATRHIHDSILQSALIAAGWREIRWALFDVRVSKPSAWHQLVSRIALNGSPPLEQCLMLVEAHRQLAP